jgi:hypothetical protein
MASETPFGPGTVTIGETGSVFAFECEVTGGSVTHEYTVVETKRKLCGDVVQDRRTRADGVKFNLEDDLTAAGLYARLAALPESPDPETITYVPSTEVEWPAVGLITFTPGTTPAGLVAGKSGKALV